MSENNNKTIMLVDDDPDFLASMSTLLEGEGYNVVQLEGQVSAEEYLRDNRPDIAVIDVIMEYRDSGFCLAHNIKKLYPDVPVIMVTAVTADTRVDFSVVTSEERSWIKAEARLGKPVRFEQLRREVEKLLKSA